MNRIERCFNQLKAQGRQALIPYVTAGDPGPAVTVPLMHAMVDAGADVIELGVPFSDPMADGPVIQLACERALTHNTRLLDVLDMVAEFRQKDQITPVVLMGYLNPVEVLGYRAFAEKAAQAGVDGALIVDLPPEEAEGEFDAAMKANGLDTIYLLAPTTEESRIEQVCKAGSGYLYYVSVKGVTGSATLDVDAVAEKLQVIRQYTDLPLGVGFGIKDAASAKAVAQVADGVIVGSVLVNKIASLVGQQEAIPANVAAIVAEMHTAMNA
ncbi:MAG: tryptophan synthase subunit alpha [Pontibacterium sp.]